MRNQKKLYFVLPSNCAVLTLRKNDKQKQNKLKQNNNKMGTFLYLLLIKYTFVGRRFCMFHSLSCDVRDVHDVGDFICLAGEREK